MTSATAIRIPGTVACAPFSDGRDSMSPRRNSEEEGGMVRWTWLVVSISLIAMQTQNLPMPGKPSDGLAAAKVFDYGALAVTHNSNGSERRDVVTAGRLATGEPVHIHESMQPSGTPPSQPHTIEHSEFILVTEGTLEISHDGRTER